MKYLQVRLWLLWRTYTDPNTLSLIISESLVEQGLKALIDSGELSIELAKSFGG